MHITDKSYLGVVWEGEIHAAPVGGTNARGVAGGRCGGSVAGIKWGAGGLKTIRLVPGRGCAVGGGGCAGFACIYWPV